MGDTRRATDAPAGKKSKKQEGKKGAPRSAGHNGPKYARYFSRPLEWENRKLRRILHRNGKKTAAQWAKAHGPAVEKLLAKIIAGGIKVRAKESAEKKRKVRPIPKPAVAANPKSFSGLGPLCLNLGGVAVQAMPKTRINGHPLTLGSIAQWLDQVSPGWRERQHYKARKKAKKRTVRVKRTVAAKPAPRLKGAEAIRAFLA